MHLSEHPFSIPLQGVVHRVQGHVDLARPRYRTERHMDPRKHFGIAQGSKYASIPCNHTSGKIDNPCYPVVETQKTR